MKKQFPYIAVLLLMVLSVLAGLFSGSEFIGPSEIAGYLSDGSGSLKMDILFRLRLPRVIAAAFAGAALSVSGAAFQSLFRNPLADPFITGVSGGASLGITISVVLSAGPVVVLFSSFGGSIGAITLLYLLSYGRGFGGGGFILAGVALSLIFSSSVMLIFSMADSNSVHKALIWMMGDLSSTGGAGLGVISLLITVIIFLLWIFHRHLDIISLGHQFSKNSGMSDMELRVILLLASLLPALSVALGGIIPFIGLMVPHLARMTTGDTNRGLIPLSAAGGAAFLILADAVGRSIISPYEIPVGIITGLAGGAFFLFFIIGRREGVGL